MKRITFMFLTTISAVVLLFGYTTSTAGPLATGSSTSIRSGASFSSGTTTSGGTGGSGGGTGSTSTPSATTGTATRTVTGSVAQTQWGPVQVELTITSKTITGVNVVQYPNGNGRDYEINSYALPILVQETISAQNASIDMVSGATVTSGGYLESLQNALDSANL